MFGDMYLAIKNGGKNYFACMNTELSRNRIVQLKVIRVIKFAESVAGGIGYDRFNVNVSLLSRY